MTDETEHQGSTEGAARPRRPVLGLRVAQRRRALSGSGGRRLAEAVGERHEPALGPSATRLSTARLQRRSNAAAAGPRPAPVRAAEPFAAPAEDVVDPANEAGASLSDFAQRWLFGDGEVEGTPVVPGAPPPGTEDDPRPSFLREQHARSEAAEAAAEARRQAPQPRGQVLEASPGGFRLASRPPVQAQRVEDAPKIESVEAPAPVVEAAADPVNDPPQPPTGPARPVPPAAAPDAGEPVPAAASPRPAGPPPRVVARPVQRQAAPPAARPVLQRRARSTPPPPTPINPTPPPQPEPGRPAPRRGVVGRAVDALRGRQAPEAPAPPVQAQAAPAAVRSPAPAAARTRAAAATPAAPELRGRNAPAVETPASGPPPTVTASPSAGPAPAAAEPAVTPAASGQAAARGGGIDRSADVGIAGAGRTAAGLPRPERPARERGACPCSHRSHAADRREHRRRPERSGQRRGTARQRAGERLPGEPGLEQRAVRERLCGQHAAAGQLAPGQRLGGRRVPWTPRRRSTSRLGPSSRLGRQIRRSRARSDRPFSGCRAGPRGRRCGRSAPAPRRTPRRRSPRRQRRRRTPRSPRPARRRRPQRRRPPAAPSAAGPATDHPDRRPRARAPGCPDDARADGRRACPDGPDLRRRTRSPTPGPPSGRSPSSAPRRRPRAPRPARRSRLGRACSAASCGAARRGPRPRRRARPTPGACGRAAPGPEGRQAADPAAAPPLRPARHGGPDARHAGRPGPGRLHRRHAGRGDRCGLRDGRLRRRHHRLRLGRAGRRRALGAAPPLQALGLDDLRSAVPAASSLAHAVAPSLPIEQGLHAVSGAASQATHLAQSVGHAAAGAAGAAAHAAGGGGAADELYEQVVERLRRELLVERERMGDLLGDL